MRKIIIFLSISLIALISSCSKDDDIGSLPPTEVTNIQAVVVERTTVRVNWNPSEDPNNDKISYDVVVNDKIIASKTSETFIEFNALEFVSPKSANAQNDTTNKGLTLALVIKIKARDTNDNVSKEVELRENVFLDVIPSAVASIDAEVLEGTMIKVKWKPSDDPNDDVLSYDVVVNDKVVANKTTETFVEFDAAELLYSKDTIAQKENTSKGLTLELAIKIKVYDTNSNVSEEVELVKNVFLNIPPSAVIAIDAEVLEGTMVKVTWKPSEDPNDDVLSYDVVVNDKVVADKTTETFVEFDAEEFILAAAKNAQKGNANKGATLELVIRIKVYDTNSNVSEEVEVTKNVFVNRSPGVFEFDNISFDTDSYNWMNISWNPASDIDGDIISYDVYLNDIVIKEGYIIGSDSNLGAVTYNENFEQYTNDEFVIKVIANDRSGGIYEISETYNFRATDIDKGSLSTPHESTEQIIIEDIEPDNKIGYAFEISETIGYSIFSSNTEMNMRLRDSEGNYINSGGSKIFGESIAAGKYYLEVSKYYYSNTSSGTLTFIFKDPKESDQDLGALIVPYDESLDFSILDNEPDNKIGYTFQITEETGFSAFTQNEVEFYLSDSNGNYISSGSRKVSIESLSAGTYYLEVSKYYYNNNVNSGTFTLILDNPKASDQDLGLLAMPYNGSVDFSINNREIDNKIRYSFEVSADAGYSFSTQANVDLNLYYSDGNYIKGNYRNISGANLSPGLYYIEVINYNSYNNDTIGTLSIVLDDPKASNIDLGALTAPYNQSYDYSTVDEVDKRIGYEFTVNAEVNYNFQIISANYDEYIYLYDSLGNLINSSDYSAITGTLNAGSYYVEAGGYNDSYAGTGTLTFDLQ